MAYESDDLKPVRPLSRDAKKRDDVNPIVESRTVSGATPDAAKREVRVVSTRAGDDDLRPPCPADTELRNRRLGEQPQEGTVSLADSRTRRDDPAPDLVNAEAEKNGLLQPCKCVCGAIAAIVLLGVFGSTFHSIAVAQSKFELLVQCGIAFLQVLVVLVVVFHWRRTFSALPEFDHLRRADYVGAQGELSVKLRTGYIRNFPDRDEYARVAGFQADAPVLQMLMRLKNHRYADHVGFMEEYENFQRGLDERSSEIILKYAKAIAIKTAASPWKAVDVISVFYNSTLMVCELAKVYHRKTTRAEATRLIGHWAVNLYISGELGQVAEMGSDAVVTGVTESIGRGGIEAFLRSATPLLSKFCGKLAEGGTNAYLAYRLGQRACLYFRELVD